MKKIFPLLLFLLLGACAPGSEPEVFVKARPEKRPDKRPHMPSIEKPLDAPHDPENPHLPSIAPQIGIRVPLQVD